MHDDLWKKIELARKRLVKAIHRTPTVYSDTISKRTGNEVFLKLENLQKTGSFKIRGAYFKMSQLSPSQRGKGVVAASAGNHAQGVALASSLLGIHSTIVMPEDPRSPSRKPPGPTAGEVVLFGSDVDEALDHARELEKGGKTFIHPFDDEEMIAGQGTIGLEILERGPGGRHDHRPHRWRRLDLRDFNHRQEEKAPREDHRRPIRPCFIRRRLLQEKEDR